MIVGHGRQKDNQTLMCQIQQGCLRWNEGEWESMTTLRAVEKVTHHPPYGGLLILVLHDPPVHP